MLIPKVNCLHVAVIFCTLNNYVHLCVFWPQIFKYSSSNSWIKQNKTLATNCCCKHTIRQTDNLSQIHAIRFQLQIEIQCVTVTWIIEFFFFDSKRWYKNFSTKKKTCFNSQTDFISGQKSMAVNVTFTKVIWTGKMPIFRITIWISV